MKYRIDIQLLRGYCIIVIVLYHANILKFGYIAVLVFITISGYLASSTKLHSYILKRYIRLLYPCFTNMTFILLYYNDEYDEDNFYQIIYEILSTVLLYTNYYYIYFSTDYFNPPENSFFLHHWYISVDIQLYLLSIFSFNNSRYFNIFLSTISIIVYLLTFTECRSYNYFSFMPRIWQYLFPKIMIIYATNKKVKYISIFLLISIIFYSNKFINEIIYQIVVVISTYIYLSITMNLSFYILEIVGVMSYYIYLTHYPIIKFESFNISSIAVILFFTIMLYCIFGQNPLVVIINHKPIYILLFIAELVIYIFVMINKIDHKNLFEIKDISSLYRVRIDRNDYCCYSKYMRGKNSRRILMVGDSHAFNLLGNFYTILKLNKYDIFYKYIHTEFIVTNHTDLYDISDNFHLIINMNLFYDNKHYEYLKLYPKRIVSYLVYLKSKSKYFIYFSPTPVLKHRISCKNQKKKVAHIGYDIQLYTTEVNKSIGISVIDISHLFCKNSTCILNYKGNCVYSDEHHFTFNFYKSIFNYTVEAIKPYIDNLFNRKILNNCNYILYKNKILRAWKYPYKGCNLKLYY